MISGKIDLHTHTTYSDGSYTPAQLIYRIRNAGISTFSVTDHDTVSAIPEALTLSHFYQIRLVNGVEFSTYVDDREVHILGYFFDHENPELLALLKLCSREREKRAERILLALEKLNISITMEEVFAEAGNAPVTRPHIASVLVNRGYASSFYDAFDVYLSNNGPCNEKKFALSPAAVFETVKNAGGISVLAHPAALGEIIIKKVIDAGLDGIEVFHPSHSNNHMKTFTALAKTYSLLISGGSDFHGGKKNDESNLGKFHTPETAFRAMEMHQNLAKAV